MQRSGPSVCADSNRKRATIIIDSRPSCFGSELNNTERVQLFTTAG